MSDQRLTLEQANQIIARALEHSAAAGYKPMAVVVLDDAGHVKSAQRQDGASMFRIDIATGKAWGAIAMGAASRVLTQPPPARASSFRRPAPCW